MVESGNHTSRVHVKRVDATSLQPVTCHPQPTTATTTTTTTTTTTNDDDDEDWQLT